MPKLLRRRLPSLPARIKLSTPNTSELGKASLIRRANALPTNPQIPVIRTFIEENALTRKSPEIKRDFPFHHQGGVAIIRNLRAKLLQHPTASPSSHCFIQIRPG